MASYHLNNLAITTEKQGAGHNKKPSYLLRHGKYSEIRTSLWTLAIKVDGQRFENFIHGYSTRWKPIIYFTISN